MTNDELWIKIEDRFNDLPCPDRGERLASLEQYNKNGERQEDVEHDKKVESFAWWKVVFSAIGVAIVVLQIIGIIK